MISVLTSVYNENESEIRESFDSILGQTYRDFELIVVLDNPNNETARRLLDEYVQRDSRVKVAVNETNIGLALSMNVAAEMATGEYLLRMDADDVCMLDRFQKQIDAIAETDYALVCGSYDFVDEAGNLLPQKAPFYNERQLTKLLPYRNVIHHPTVIMRADKFREVGGYRNYPCAQDYDLWLRMLLAGAKMRMQPEKLIKYRVRAASTTLSKRYRQSCTGEYIRRLYWQKNGMSGYSYESYLAYLEKRGANDQNANADFIANSALYQDSKRALKRGRVLSGALGLSKVFFKSKYYRPNVVNSAIVAFITKFAK
jgi:glycosyltransferase involved in cell wall biosynthesis